MSDVMKKRPFLSAGFVRGNLGGHSALGLVFGALAYLICVTGTLAVFVGELTLWEQPAAPVVTRIAPGVLAHAVNDAVTRAADDKIKSVTFNLPTAEWPRLRMTVNTGTGHSHWLLNAAGDTAVPDRREWSEFLVGVHMNFHSGASWGYLVVGLVGVGMLGLAISGVLAHPRIFRDAFALRWGGSARLWEADLHNRLSVWGLPFNIAVNLTGAYLGVVSLLIMLVSAIAYGGNSAKLTAPVRAPVVAADATPAPLIDIDAAMDYMRADPDVKGEPFVVTLSRPGTVGQSMTGYTHVDRRLVFGEFYHFSKDGPVRVGYSTGDVGVQLYASSYRLHFGDFGGLPVKILYFILGGGLSVVASSGIRIWLIRRRAAGRPAPRFERLWTATAWGVPLALAVSAVAYLCAEINPPWVFWATLAVPLVAAFCVTDGQRLSRVLRTVLAVSLFALVAVHIALNGPAAWTALPATVNGLFVLSGLGLLVWVWRARVEVGEPAL